MPPIKSIRNANENRLTIEKYMANAFDLYRSPNQCGIVTALISFPIFLNLKEASKSIVIIPKNTDIPRCINADKPCTKTKPGLTIKVAADAVLAARVIPTTIGERLPSPMANEEKSFVRLLPKTPR
jgi:hypothetical protein